MSVDRRISQMPGPAAPPRKNGELVFAAPWQGRAFGVGVALCHRGAYRWEEFQRRLITEVASADAAGEPGVYYEQWLAALEKLLVEKQVVSPEEIARRAAEIRRGDRE